MKPAQQALVALCDDEATQLRHLLLSKREFTADFYDALEERALSFAQLYLERAAMFARSRVHARLGKVPAGQVTLCEADLNNAWDVLVQEERQ